MALEFILAVDESCYATLAPSHLRMLVSDTEELALPPTPSFLGLDISVITNFVVMFGLLAIYGKTLIAPHVAILDDMADALCGKFNSQHGHLATCCNARLH